MIPLANITGDTVRDIVAIDDQPILRNLLITQAYHVLSKRLARVLGHENANWCAYAIWASKTAGFFIREDEVPRAFRRLLARKERFQDRIRDLNDALCAVHDNAALYSVDDLNPIGEVVDEVRLYVEGGNKIVFAELGAFFADFIAAFEGDTQFDSEKLAEFVARLRPGRSIPDEVELLESRDRLIVREKGGQDLLRDASGYYYQAIFEDDSKRKAELILLANAMSGLHEQIRLQPYIAGSLGAPVSEILYSRHNNALLQRVGQSIFGAAQESLHRWLTPVGEELTETFREFATIHMMQMTTPDDTLQLGENLPAPRGRTLFPPVLSVLENQALIKILRQYRAYGGSDQPSSFYSWMRSAIDRAFVALHLRRPVDFGSAASDWADLTQRMRYIFAYFRSRQQVGSLLESPPFSPAQAAAIQAGNIPDGPLG